MSMSKKDFIALADAIKSAPTSKTDRFKHYHLDVLADFCQSQNPNFLRDRWMGYIKGENGQNGGKVDNQLGRAPVGVKLAK